MKPIAKAKLKCNKKPYYFNLYLWEDQKQFCYKTKQDSETWGYCRFSPVNVDLKTNKESPSRPKLGEVHFIKDKWDLEIVSHELCHCLLVRLEILKPRFSDVIEYNDNSYEDICYEFGKWVEDVYAWLWKVNPSEKWVRKNDQ